MARPTIKIFISHAKKDEALAQVFVDYLKSTLTIQDEREILCTSLPGHELPPGASHKIAIRTAIREASVIIGLLTPSSLERQAVMMELGGAWALEKEFMPLLFGVGFDRIPEWVQAQAVRLDHSIEDFRTLNKRATPIAEETSHQTGYALKNNAVIGDANIVLFEALKALLPSIVPETASEVPKLDPAVAAIVRRAKSLAASLRASEGKKGTLSLASLRNVETYNKWLDEAIAAGSAAKLQHISEDCGILDGISTMPYGDFISSLELMASEIEASPVLKPPDPPPTKWDTV